MLLVWHELFYDSEHLTVNYWCIQSWGAKTVAKHSHVKNPVLIPMPTNGRASIFPLKSPLDQLRNYCHL